MTPEQIAALTAWKLMGDIRKVSDYHLEMLRKDQFEMPISKSQAFAIEYEAIERANLIEDKQSPRPRRRPRLRRPL